MSSLTKGREDLTARAVILDWDDTMALSSEDQHEALRRAFAQFRAEYWWAASVLDVETLLDDFPPDAFKFYKFHADPADNLSDFKNLIGYLVETYRTKEYVGEEKEKIVDIILTKNYEEIRKKTSTSPQLLRGALDSIRTLADKGIPIGITSSKVHEVLFEGIQNTPLGNHFKLVPMNEFGKPVKEDARGNPDGPTLYVLGSYRKRGWPRKPDPLQYLQMIAAMEALGEGEHVWSVGDIPKDDIEPIRALGCTGIVFGERLSKKEVDDARPENYDKAKKTVYAGTIEGLLCAKDHEELGELFGRMTKLELDPDAIKFQVRDMAALQNSLLTERVIAGEVSDTLSAENVPDASEIPEAAGHEASFKRMQVAWEVAERKITDAMINDMVALLEDAKPPVESPLRIVFPDTMYADGSYNLLPIIGAQVLQEKLAAKIGEQIKVEVDFSLYTETVSERYTDADEQPLARRPLFGGKVEERGSYIVFNDHIRNGADEADLASHIVQNQGRALLIAGLTCALKGQELFQGNSDTVLKDTIQKDAAHMVDIMHKNEIPDTPTEDEQNKRLTRYLDTALGYVGLSIENLTRAQAVALAEYIYPSESRSSTVKPGHVYGAVNAIYGELVKSPRTIDKYRAVAEQVAAGGMST